MIQRKSLFVPAKMKYVRGHRPDVKCILCSVAQEHKEVENLLVARDRHVFVTLNLFPYNPGHLMVVPIRHVTDPRQCTKPELAAVQTWTIRVLDALDDIYTPFGYNVGYNIGHPAGASIDHLHQHIVPRYKNEVGFIDVIAGTRIHVEDPARTLETVRGKLKGGNTRSR